MIWMMDERRGRRSQQSHVALRYQLEHTREKAGLGALVLADRDGLAVAQSGDSAMCAELAAVAPLLQRSVLGMPMPPLLQGADVAVRSIWLNGQELYLASTGGGMARDALLSHSMQGVRRILASN